MGCLYKVFWIISVIEICVSVLFLAIGDVQHATYILLNAVLMLILAMDLEHNTEGL